MMISNIVFLFIMLILFLVMFKINDRYSGFIDNCAGIAMIISILVSAFIVAMFILNSLF